ncbi:hypothetical protein CMI47_08705 [Candidatus Pacearchaeota archaeon]|nr:hypothetical protein [Candidatus Pacearchaeota archaeon]
MYQDMYLRNNKYPKYVFEHSYVTGVLGIRLPLHESYPYSPALQKRILQEQLLFEGFWSELYDKGKEKLMSAADGIKKFGKEAWGILSAMWTVIKGGAKEIESFTGAVAKKGINWFFRQIRKPLEWLVENLPKWGMPTFAEWAQKGLDTLTAAGEKVESLDGWKRVIGFAGLAIGLHWLWEKVGDWIDELKEKIGGDFDAAAAPLGEAEGVSSKMDAVKEWIKDTITEKLKALAGEAFSGIMEKLTGAFTGVKPWWDAAKKIAGGAKLVIDALGSAATRFLARQKKLVMPGESGGDTETQSEAIRRRHTTIKITEQQLRVMVRAALVEQVVGYTAPEEKSSDSGGYLSIGDVGVDTPTGDSDDQAQMMADQVKDLTQQRQQALDQGDTVTADNVGKQLALARKMRG